MAAPTDRELVRWYATGNKDDTTYLGNDNLVDHALSEENDNARLAAARALEAVASSAALEAKSQGSSTVGSNKVNIAKELREQAIDGTQLPEFDNVRRYLGPAGLIIRRVEDGWLLEGMTLTKTVGPLVEHDDPGVETARVDG